MSAQRLGRVCVVVSLVLHGIVAVVTLANGTAASQQPATVYEVVLAPGSVRTVATAQQFRHSNKRSVSALAQPATATPGKSAAVVSPAVPAAAVADLSMPPAVPDTRSTGAAESGSGLSSLRAITSGGVRHSARNDGAASPLLQLGSSGAPAFSQQAVPVYPAQARRLGREGTVVLRVSIDAAGKLQGVTVLQAAAYGFTEAAVEAIRQSSYRPAQLGGRTFQADALVTIRFKLRS